MCVYGKSVNEAPPKQTIYLFQGLTMTMTIMMMMMTTMMRPMHISFLVLFCSLLASTNAVVPEETYSTDLATCKHGCTVKTIIYNLNEVSVR